MASSEDLNSILELEGWTNDRISGEFGLLRNIPEPEWVIGTPNASVVMAAYCHPHPEGGRFNDSTRGAWYTAFDLETAQRETVHRRTQELDEIGVYETAVQMRQYLSDFDAEFHDIRTDAAFDSCHDPNSYVQSQALALQLFANGSNGILYRSVRHNGGNCLVCFRPRLVTNVRTGAHYEYRWEGGRVPQIRELRV